MSTQNQTTIVSLIPLSLHEHVTALQQVYQATPHYWQMHNFPACPPTQAESDLKTAATTPGRTLLGIVRRIDPADLAPTDLERRAEMVGMIDLRLHWPGQTVVSIGLFMLAESQQRRGIATQAWNLLSPWLATSAGMLKARLGVEQFNGNALKFFAAIGFKLTGETSRVRVGERFVRLLYMEQELRES